MSYATPLSFSLPSWNEAKEFLTSPDAEYYKYAPAIKNAVFTILQSIVTFMLYSTLTIIKLALLVFPSVKSTTFAIVDYHKKNLGFREYLIEFIFIFSLLIWYLYGQSIKRSYFALQKKIEEKSRFIAIHLPLILYLVTCAFVTFAGAKIITPLITPGRLPLITVVAPLCSTIMALIEAAPSTNAGLSITNSNNNNSSASAANLNIKNSESALVSTIRLWLIIGTYHSIHMLFDTIPLVSRVVKLVGLNRSYFSIFWHVILISTQLNSKIAALVLNYFFNPVISYIERYIPSSNRAETVFQGLLYPLSLMNIVSQEKIDMLSKFSRDFLISCVAVFSILVSYPLINIGLLTIVFFIPLSRCSSMITTPSSSMKRSELHERCSFWLRYWLLVAFWLLWEQTIGNLSNHFLFMRLSIILFMWLQHEYYRGSDKVLSYVMDVKRSLKAPPRVLVHVPVEAGGAEDSTIGAQDGTLRHDTAEEAGTLNDHVVETKME